MPAAQDHLPVATEQGETLGIRRCDDSDFEQVWAIINDGAQAYKGIIPADRWKEPYMSHEELRRQVEERVNFWDYEDDGKLMAVMRIQPVREVTLIRHAYVRTRSHKRGVGGLLLSRLRLLTETPFVVGTWADAGWAIRFYERHGFRLVDLEEKDRLLRGYWIISERQVETSVVLADAKWRKAQS
jgi:GNAT superfamily N-acetyltransferase